MLLPDLTFSVLQGVWQRCSHRHALLLSAAHGGAPISMRRCSQRRPAMLPSACAVAISSTRWCSHQHAALLSAASSAAPSGSRRCYQRPCCAPSGRRLCYHRSATLLQAAGGVATKGRQGCCQRATVLLPKADDVATNDHVGIFSGDDGAAMRGRSAARGGRGCCQWEDRGAAEGLKGRCF
jgi:hypothetical protein